MWLWQQSLAISLRSLECDRKENGMDFLKNLANLIKVKTLVTLVVIAVWAVLALRSDIKPESVMYIVTAVVSFYFGTQLEKGVR